MLKPFIDAHVHLNTTSAEKMKLAEKHHVGFLSINTDIPFFNSISDQEKTILELQKDHLERVRYVTSFHNHHWNTDKWLPSVLEQIQTGIEHGAVGVKIWKNIGMDDTLKDENGQFVMLDDPRFDPLYEYLIKNNILLLGHQGEPKNCWLSLEEMTVNSDRDYFQAHPEYHMYKHPEYPSYETQMEARNNVLEKFPGLKYVGLHLFSMEWSLDEVARLLDRYPQTMTDLAERICHVQLQAQEDHNKVRDFFIDHQDRIIYGSDVIDDGTLTANEVAKRFETLWQAHWNFFATNKTLTAPEFDGEFTGLKLPEEVLYKLFTGNAVKTYGFNEDILKNRINYFKS